ncbi:MAG TPA: transglutaminase-like domain-containing protein, partial [Nitrospirota bacterium]|nr:transglutaminase-like domain-containing protein [Nitrospirota bacterium]
IISVLILLFWVTMLGLLVERTYLRPSAVIALDAATEEGVRATDEWFGIYQKGAKIGYAYTSIRPEAETYHLREESELDILALGSLQRVKTKINSYTTRNFLLKYFDFSLQSEATSMKIKGAGVGKKLIVDIMTGGQTRTERIPLASPPYLSVNIKPALLLAGLEPGKTYRFPIFNPATMSTEDADITVDSKERIKVGSAEQNVYKLRESFQGMETTSWVNQDGETLKEESALGYILVKEPMAEARKRDKGGPVIDIISLTMIPSDPIKEPSKVHYLRARLKGVPLTGFPLDGDRQTLKGDVLEVLVDNAPGNYLLPHSGGELAGYLQPNALIQSDDKKIIDQTVKILAGEKNAREAAKKLNTWVYTVIDKKPVVSIPSALEVLKQREGDCNEHTALYTALARAAGIPTRMAAGIVYLENGFYYHAWPEVWLGAWVAVDPTFDQFPADATHIRFVTGNLDRQSDIVRLVGKLKVEVLEYR